MKPKHVYTFTLAFYANLLLVAPTFADIVLNDGKVVGINNLTIADTIYNVRFSPESFNDLFGTYDSTGPDPTFWGDLTGADQAAIAIANYLEADNRNALDFIVTDYQAGPIYTVRLYIPIQFSPYAGWQIQASSIHNGVMLPNVDYDWNTDTMVGTPAGYVVSWKLSETHPITLYTTFEVVPLPSAVILGALGLATTSVMIRRKRTQNKATN